MKTIFPTIERFLKTAKKPILAIIGPTASGKTSASIEIAQRFKGEIINADSRQVFKYIDIASAKIKEEEMEGIPHHLFSFVEPDQFFNLAQWKKEAEERAEEILSRGKIPILCGGTSLYIRAITKGFSIPSIPPNKEFRESLQKFSNQELWEKLEKLDTESAKKFHKNNRKAVERALEICEFSGDIKKDECVSPKFDSLILGVSVNREKLYERIDKRVYDMIDEGLMEEIKNLLKKGYKKGEAGMISHGIPEAIDFLENKISLEEFVAKMQQNTRNFAKRQLTWWRNDEQVAWFTPNDFIAQKEAECS